MAARSEQPEPEIALVNARVHPRAGRALAMGAIGIRDGCVAVLGTRDDVLSVLPGARRIDLHGATVLPALVDSHTHFHRGAVLARFYLDFENPIPRAVDEILDRVRARAGELEPGEWIQGDGLSTFRLAESRLPDRRELDSVAPRNPVALRGIGKHVVAANSLALAAAGIDRTTPDPPGGRIERDADGEPTGILHERAKLRLDQSHPQTVLPKPSKADRLDALKAGSRELHRRGVATIHEMVRLPEEADDLATLHASGELDVRVRIYYRVYETPISLDSLVALGIKRGLGNDRFRIAGVKISVDGFDIFRNAAVYEPYRGEPDNTGILRIEPDELCRLVRIANVQGLNVAIHAVGVRAVDAALDAFEAAGPPLAGPHRIEHAYVDVDEPRLRRMRSLGLALSTQPGFLAAYRREWEEIFGPERTDRIMPIRQAHDLGIPILLNSDYPCAPIDPAGAVRLAVERRVGDRTIGAGAAIPGEVAWAAVTETPAGVVGDSRLGRLDVGYLADLVVYDIDPTDTNRAGPDAAVCATMIDGRFVFDAAGVGA